MNTQATARAVLGPLTAREVTLCAGIAVLALASLLSFGRTRGDFAVIVLALLAPLATGSAVLLRRFTSRSRLDLGSFSLDQLAAVVSGAAFVVALGGLGGAGSFVQFLGVVGSAAMLAATFGAHWIGAFNADYAQEPGVHLLRRDIVPSSAQGEGAGATEGEHPASGTSWFTAPAQPAAAAHTTVLGTSARQTTQEQVAFWFAVPDARPATNRATGAKEFMVTPGQWWLALRSVPEGLVVKHDDGREALLADVTDLERG